MFIDLNFKLLILIIFLSPSVLSFSSYEKKINSISKDDIKKELRQFVSCCRPNRMVGSKGHLLSSKWLLDRINKIKGDGVLHIDSFKPDIDHAIKQYQNDFKQKIVKRFPQNSYEYQKWNKATQSAIFHLNKRRDLLGKNIIWEKQGIKKPEEILVIGVNYDTIAVDPQTQIIDEKSTMPGADDNGSGVSIALNLIKLLSNIKLDKTIQIVFFDFQELGFLGSRNYVKKYGDYFKKNKFFGFVNLLMLGHDSKSTDLKKTHGNMKAYIRREGLNGHQNDKLVFEQFNKSHSRSKTSNTFELVANSFDSSDIVSFWNAGLPAIVFTGDWENDYNIKRHHTSNDFPETLNFNSLYQSYLYIAYGVLGWNFNLL